ncbi:hypothetical protein [Rhodococcoides fascians]|uniref:hypothetical protein n=1 Tax=Rhodococcoides fascians TaxID=1828 RepID=UPI0005625978|nr:hypothetical protein [Rhodococcus fascians]
MEIAVVALAVSVFSLLWNVGSTWIRWPRLAVIIYPTTIVNMGTDQVTERYRLIVVNMGAEAVTIANLGLRTKDFTMVLDWDQETEHDSAELRFGGPPLPLRLDGHGSETWTIDEDALFRFRHKSEIFGYVWRYRKPWRWPKRMSGLIRESTSAKPAIRNGNANPALP